MTTLWLNNASGAQKPKQFTGVVGKVQKGRQEGRVENKAHTTRLQGPGLEPGTYRLLGKSPQLHATVIV